MVTTMSIQEPEQPTAHEPSTKAILTTVVATFFAPIVILATMGHFLLWNAIGKLVETAGAIRRVDLPGVARGVAGLVKYAALGTVAYGLYLLLTYGIDVLVGRIHERITERLYDRVDLDDDVIDTLVAIGIIIVVLATLYAGYEFSKRVLNDFLQTASVGVEENLENIGEAMASGEIFDDENESLYKYEDVEPDGGVVPFPYSESINKHVLGDDADELSDDEMEENVRKWQYDAARGELDDEILLTLSLDELAKLRRDGVQILRHNARGDEIADISVEVMKESAEQRNGSQDEQSGPETATDGGIDRID